MLLQRSLLLLDFAVLFSIFVLLVLMPAERCAHFEMVQSSNPVLGVCNFHPKLHLKSGRNVEEENQKQHVSICHHLKWSHFNFWENMYLIILPGFICFLLCFMIIGELTELDMFRGRIQTTGILIFSFIAMLIVLGAIFHERFRIHHDWPLSQHSHNFGGQLNLTNIETPNTWQYSIALCVLSALFKIGRLVIQHYFGDSKIFFDDEDVEKPKRNSATEIEEAI